MFALEAWELKAIGGALLIAAGLAWLGIHNADERKAGAQGVTQAVQAVTAAASAADAVKVARQDAAQKGNLNAATLQDAGHAGDARELDDFVRRVRLDADRGRSAQRPTSGASSACSGDCVPASELVRYRLLYARAAEAAASASEYADCLYVGGYLCALDYGALMPPGGASSPQ